jgi:archaellum component FlaF (FlaF/FlaG flagellin family)
LTKTREKEVILPPMKMVFNKNSTSNMVNVTNIIVNGRYVRNGSNTKKYIPRNYATRIKPNAV